MAVYSVALEPNEINLIHVKVKSRLRHIQSLDRYFFHG